ncbi:MAG TPA: PEGA domain-containing protein [Vicinamibacterales bacterium]
MDTGSSHTPAPRRSVFEDGFGKRHHAVGPGGEPLEVLEFKDELTADPSFELALRERVNALVGFQNTCFARVRSVQRLGQNASKLVVISDRVPGARLSTVLAVAKQQLLPLEINAALCLIRQLVPAMAALHDKMPSLGHGALSPERIVITPNARLVVVDHMLGGTVEQLRYTHDRYWKELRIPLPTAAQPTFDHRADVMQVGMVALALILGRPLDGDDYPGQIAALAEGAWGLTATGGVEPLPTELRTWLARMLQLDGRQSFATAVDAWSELERVLGASDYVASFGALKSFMAEYARYTASGAPASVATPAPSGASPTAGPPTPAIGPPFSPTRVVASLAPTPGAPAAAPAPVVPAATAPPVPGQTPPRAQQPPPSPVVAASRPVAPAPVTVDAPATIFATPRPPVVSSADAPATIFATPRLPVVSSAPATVPTPAAPRPPAPPPAAAPAPPPAASMTERLRTTAAAHASAQAALPPKNDAPWWRQRRVAAAAGVLLALACGGAFVTRSYLPSAAAEAPGTLVVNTNPAGVPVVIDGQPRGVTPLTLELAPGAHELRLATSGDPRIIPLTITAGGTVSQSLELPKAGPHTGQLMVRSEPSGARVTVDGMPRGQAPLTLDGLTPGDHTVVLANDLSSVTHSVSVEAGATASLIVPMSASPQGVPVSGWISVSAPAEVQVYEDTRLIGTSRSDRIMVSAGRHELDIVNESLGFRATRVVTVSPGQVSALRLEWPKGSMALNAQPWADVWIDGERVGETPIGNVAVPIGPHEVVFRHPQLGEQVVRATVTAGESTRVSVDMRKR